MHSGSFALSKKSGWGSRENKILGKYCLEHQRSKAEQKIFGCGNTKQVSWMRGTEFHRNERGKNYAIYQCNDNTNKPNSVNQVASNVLLNSGERNSSKAESKKQWERSAEQRKRFQI